MSPVGVCLMRHSLLSLDACVCVCKCGCVGVWWWGGELACHLYEVLEDRCLRRGRLASFSIGSPASKLLSSDNDFSSGCDWTRRAINSCG